ncbi:Component of inositol phosphorylceramide (IPC) synthase [Komagataella phaffii CBS 7435]|uniref:Component of the inositol phosphorylceramide synthase n=2 Tax=Komagataella phaffii TaxID=460519 RepID=C4R3K7_KOMPG|nr:Component of the inositol phosphorylceramide synthase [Komagataella phaffii GS115]AOA63323.1 GQ67_03128T0 [Komagataella phaffii]CAH2450225.1 Component of inositol phosphorylceramide (IPC) synthase [Komagataella phaffii CBS 7435]AOA68972.1 GQ68_03112T0 [Komagataella phaffii GS115]CAY70042.1 Component of the inositol phosphorylceramide synthase [Komagataella phaffii GS115]SCV12312.1 Component of inositol phosphorylceramide (IPC) synthase [Komagataella phaffii CBS 7435]
MGFLNSALPKKFLGIFPLYIGVELILGYAIINKMSGPYGLLSLFTGHPIDFFQAMFYISSVIVLPLYFHGFKELFSPRIGMFSLVTTIYVLDTFLGLLSNLYFALQWFTYGGEDTTINKPSFGESATTASESIASAATSTLSFSSFTASPTPDFNPLDSTVPQPYKREMDENVQSASQARELFVIIASSVLLNGVRIYFTLILLAFTKILIRMGKNEGIQSNDFNDLNYMQGETKFGRVLYFLKVKCLRILQTVYNY